MAKEKDDLSTEPVKDAAPVRSSEANSEEIGS